MQIFEKLRNDQLKVKSEKLENLTKEELIEKCKKLQESNSWMFIKHIEYQSCISSILSNINFLQKENSGEFYHKVVVNDEIKNS